MGSKGTLLFFFSFQKDVFIDFLKERERKGEGARRRRSIDGLPAARTRLRIESSAWVCAPSGMGQGPWVRGRTPSQLCHTCQGESVPFYDTKSVHRTVCPPPGATTSRHLPEALGQPQTRSCPPGWSPALPEPMLPLRGHDGACEPEQWLSLHRPCLATPPPPENHVGNTASHLPPRLALAEAGPRSMRRGASPHPSPPPHRAPALSPGFAAAAGIGHPGADGPGRTMAEAEDLQTFTSIMDALVRISVSEGCGGGRGGWGGEGWWFRGSGPAGTANRWGSGRRLGCRGGAERAVPAERAGRVGCREEAAPRGSGRGSTGGVWGAGSCRGRALRARGWGWAAGPGGCTGRTGRV